MSMKGLCRVLFVGLAMSGAAEAQEWQTYTYPDPGFAIQFPGVPEVQTTTFKNAVGVTRPVTRYVVRREGVHYTLSVVDYSHTNADALSIIGETVKSFSAKGKLSSNTGARVNGSSGRELTVTENDGSRSDVAIFFFGNHLYTAVGQALPPHPMERSADTGRFRGSLRFLGDDSGFFGLFPGRDRTSSNTGASTVTSNRANGTSAGNGTGGGDSGSRGGGGTGSGDSGSRSAAGSDAAGAYSGSRGTGGEHSRTDANQRADAACAGKSAGDVVQLDTPAGPVPATCTLTARPNRAAGSKP
jgi:hypothetical protein